MKTPTDEIIAAYMQTGSVWKAGKQLGLAGQTVHERLRAVGHQLASRRWAEDEDEELRSLVAAGLTASQIADRLGRSFAAVTCRMNEHGLKVTSRRQAKIPRGVGLDKASVLAHMAAMERGKVPVTRYARSHGLSVDNLVLALQTHCLERHEAHLATIGGLNRKTCDYCDRPYTPANSKQRFCTRRCGTAASTDASYFGGKRKTTVGLADGVCQLCGATKDKGLSSHHVIGKENDPDNDQLIALCAGCHKAVTFLASRKFVDDTATWQALIQLAWLRKHGTEIAAGGLNGQSLYVYVEIDVEQEEE